MNWLQTFRGRKGLRGRPKHSLHTCHTAAEPAAEVITNTNNMPTTDSPQSPGENVYITWKYTHFVYSRGIPSDSTVFVYH